MCTYTKWPRAWAALCSKLYIKLLQIDILVKIVLEQGSIVKFLGVCQPFFPYLFQERARPEFVHRIKNSIKKTKPEKRKKFYVTNEVLNKVEYIQPAYWFYPKLVFSFSILITMVSYTV